MLIKKVIKIKRKKSAIELETLVIAVLVLIVLVVLIAFFTKQFGKGAGTTNTMIDKTKWDCDGDGIKDIIDPCPCSTEEKGEDGKCPAGVATPENCEKFCSEKYKND